MKKTITILLAFVTLSSFGQQQYGDFENINLRSRMYSNFYNLITAHPDSTGQFLYENAADPESDLDVVNFRFLYNNYMASEVVNDSINTKLEREIPIFWEELADPPILVSDTSDFVVTVTYLSNYIDSTDVQKTVYSIEMPNAASVQGRIDGTTLDPEIASWVLTPAANNIDLIVTHNLGRRVHNVNVMTINGDIEQLLRPFAGAYSGWQTNNANQLQINGLATTPLPIKIYISFK